MEYSTNTINIFIGLKDRQHFINGCQEHCDVIQKLIYVEKWFKQQLEN